MNPRILDTLRLIAGGAGIASAVINSLWQPSVAQNWLAALIGAVLGLLLALSVQRGNA